MAEIPHGFCDGLLSQWGLNLRRQCVHDCGAGCQKGRHSMVVRTVGNQIRIGQDGKRRICAQGRREEEVYGVYVV
ncbi:hypothetical protein [Tateyamaria pelophila]|uniref:hypothetical protein n=1 Tax=Tateyamaria pelophila TaxID=328415 RepID=UPI001CBCDED4|nr:hypothetical protein [Tateyamaria pelophila]